MKYVNALIYSNHPFVRLLRHLLFWVTDIFNWLLVAAGSVPKADIQGFLLSLPIVVVSTYFIIYFILPKFSARHHKAKLFLWIIVTLIALGLLLRVYKILLLYPFLGITFPADYKPWTLGLLIREIFSWLAVISMAIIIKLVKNKSELQEKNDQLINEKKAAELNFLRAQMHPHFLFNTLNTLYSETIQNSDKAQQIVLHLSSLLRFILEECNKPMINLGKEITVIQHYIELEKLRHGSRLLVNLTVPEAGFDLPISPLIFLPFVENSFKHSLRNVRGQVCINVAIHTEKDRISLLVENDHVTSTVDHDNHGTGIANIRRQLDLLYEKDYTLNIVETSRKYEVSLSVPVKPF